MARFKRRHEYIATEVGDFYADVVSSNADELIEYEVKCTKSDLRREIHKQKHSFYNNPKSHKRWEPTRFYFCVPPELEEAAIELIEENKWSRYGVIVYRAERHISDCMEIVRKAKRLNEKAIHEKVLKRILQRTSSDLVNVYYKTNIEDKMLSTLSKISEQNTRNEDSE